MAVLIASNLSASLRPRFAHKLIVALGSLHRQRRAGRDLLGKATRGGKQVSLRVPSPLTPRCPSPTRRRSADRGVECDCGDPSLWGHVHRKTLMAPHHEALDPPGCLVGVERDAPGLFEQLREYDPALEAGEGRTDAKVDATAEREVVTRHLPIEDYLVGTLVFGGVPVGGTPKEQHLSLIHI